MTEDRKQSRSAKCICAVILAVLMFFFASIVLRTLTRQVLVKRLGMENGFTRAVLFDAETLKVVPKNDETADAEGDAKAPEKINWAALYPFPPDTEELQKGEGAPVTNPPAKKTIAKKYKQKVLSTENKVEDYVCDYLIGYQKIVELANGYEAAVRWNFVSYSEYNGIVKLPDGYLTGYVRMRDVSDAADNAIAFAEYCKHSGMDFIYVQTPDKISKTQDPNLSGTVDFSNQNADALIARLRQKDIDVFDLRDFIDAEGLNHRSLFYRTDHHWRAESGLWAARHLLAHLNQQYGYDVDPALLEPERFTSVFYPSWFLGSQGKRVTLSTTEPDDFSLFYPAYETQIRFSVPDEGIDLEGDFSVVYDMSRVDEIDYYGKNPYAAHMYGDLALARFENHLAANDIRLLCIHDSFGDCVLPFVSLGVKYVDSLDLRHFTGSVQSFIEETKPDAVIVLYNPSVIENPSNLDQHNAVFDFR